MDSADALAELIARDGDEGLIARRNIFSQTSFACFADMFLIRRLLRSIEAEHAMTNGRRFLVLSVCVFFYKTLSIKIHKLPYVLEIALQH